MECIDVIVPHFNNVEGCLKAIDSILNQKLILPNVIVVDDKSSDTNRLLLQKRLNNIANVQVIERTKNGGPGLARNTGLRLCKSKYVAFLDSDDFYIDELKLVKQVIGLQQSDSVISATAYIEKNEGNEAAIVVDGLIHYKRLLRANYIGCSTVVIDFDKVDRNINLFSAHRRRQDWICWLQILKSSPKSVVHYLRDATVIYDASNNGVSKIVSKRRLLIDTLNVYKTLGFSNLISLLYVVRFLVFQAMKIKNKSIL